MTYWIITYGCQMNKSDSERIATILENKGYLIGSNISETDLIVVNMCSVRQSAVDRVFGLIPKFEKLKIKNKKLKIILTGCILKKDGKQFTRKFDLILNIKDLLKWPEIIRNKSPVLIQPWQNYHGGYSKNYLTIRPKYQDNFRVFIPISNGCNNACTYCVVPFTRGPLVCRSHEEILEEVKNIVKKGFKEIWLLGQNVNNYHSKQKTKKVINFAELLKMVNDVPGKFWIRFTSPHPKDFSNELVETMAKCEKVTPYLNLPVQSGDDEILRRMNRPYTVKQYKNLVKKIRSAFKKYRKGLEKEVAISTDIIVGFLGETKKQFENTVRLFEEIKFDMAYIAQYSPRPGTPAAKMENDILQKEKSRRWKILNETLKKTVLGKNKKYIGKEIEVLAEGEKDGFLIGKSRHYKTVRFKGQKELIGNFMKVKILKALPWGLKGKKS